ncbi:MAG: AAA family ATPase [Cyclobacteriaceae bacterium]|nr:AAA family ATPase [Cyclobacteriaceae bacterium]
MKVDYPPYAVANLIESTIDKIDYAKKLGADAGVKEELLSLYNEVHSELLNLKSFISVNEFSTDYTQMLAEALNKVSKAFPSGYGPSRIYSPLQEEDKPIFKRQQEGREEEIQKAFLQFKLVFDFFSKVDFFNKDLVIIGSNGAGKTFLARGLMNHVKHNGVIVSAQRILQLPEFNNIKSQKSTAEELRKIHTADKDNEELRFETSNDEFGILFQHLLADDVESLKNYRKKVQESQKVGLAIEPPNRTKLERTLDIWNSVFSHLSLSLDDGINIRAHRDGISFPATEMSDGEKVALFVIAKTLQSPENGFVVVDEPEMYLHPTIHKKLWDTIENEIPDSKFIYLTHDLDFAASRVRAKRLWLRNFKYPNYFELESIPKNDIPQVLLMELLGSRQDVLFCEGEAGSLDEQIYNILFSNYIIKPVGGCLSVINFTKAFNRLPMSNRKAIGIIDGDYISKNRLDKLQSQSIFPLNVPDIENFLLDEVILQKLDLEIGHTENRVDKTKKDILKLLKREREKEISKYVSAKVDHYFKDTNVSSGKSIIGIKANYHSFIKEIDIESWAKERGELIDLVLANDDYKQAIKIFKSKGLASIVGKNFKIENYNQRIVMLIKRDKELEDLLRQQFPDIPINPDT